MIDDLKGNDGVVGPRVTQGDSPLGSRAGGDFRLDAWTFSRSVCLRQWFSSLTTG